MCASLRSIELPGSLTTIREQAFRNSGLTSIDIGPNVTEIEKYAFYECDNLTSITLPEGLRTVGTFLCYSCDNLKSATIPASVTTVESRAFGSCVQLEAVYFLGDAPQIDTYAFSDIAITVNAYYPAGNPTWTEDVLQQYGGNIAWIPNCPDGHTVVTDPALTPTCTESGLTEGSHCSVCNRVLTEQRYVSPNGHSFVDGACALCGEEDPRYVVQPTITVGAPSVSFEGEIRYNIYFTAENLDDVVEMGLAL